MLQEINSQIKVYERIVGPIEESEEIESLIEFLGDAIRNLRK